MILSKQGSIHDTVDNYMITSGYASRIVMYGGCQCLKGSYFAQLYLKVYLVSVNECCRCCNTFLKVYNQVGLRSQNDARTATIRPSTIAPANFEFLENLEQSREAELFFLYSNIKVKRGNSGHSLTLTSLLERSAKTTLSRPWQTTVADTTINM